MVLDSNRYAYKVVEGWAKLPEGWTWDWDTQAVACDSQDRVYVCSRNEPHLAFFDREGNFLGSWGGDVLRDVHGISIDSEDNVYCIEHNANCIYKFNRRGELVMILGRPGEPAENDGDPFNQPTDVGVVSTGEIFVSDGYGNARVHKFSPDGKWLLSWGERGDGPGQFEVPHSIQVDKYDRLWVCDRENHRIQIFDTEGRFLAEWTDIRRPDAIFIESQENMVYIAELDFQVSIYTIDGDLITRWGGGQKSEKLGEFLGYPHDIWVDSQGSIYVVEVDGQPARHRSSAAGRLEKFVRRG